MHHSLQGLHYSLTNANIDAAIPRWHLILCRCYRRIGCHHSWDNKQDSKCVLVALGVKTRLMVHTKMRPIVAGSGYHIASVSIGCSRLILSLHSWSEAHKPPSNPGIQNSNGFSVRNSDSQPPSYELKTQKIPDIESASVGVHMWRNNTNTIPPPVPPKDHILQSTLPNIERPSLPERMWSTLPSAHAHRDQRHSRPPRSSSLYVAGQVPDRLVLETPMATVTEELS